jgi:hypothetical protein
VQDGKSSQSRDYLLKLNGAGERQGAGNNGGQIKAQKTLLPLGTGNNTGAPVLCIDFESEA